MATTPEVEVRYPETVNPVRTDGRDIDTRLAVLEGEAAQQQAGPVEPTVRGLSTLWERTPTVDETSPTYYERPLLKESIFGIDIPLYYFVGGAAGAALALGSALQLLAHDNCAQSECRRFAARCHWIGVTGSTIGAALLIHDLGRPSRFLHMLRVFRPTSPMNMGAWILGGAAPTAITTALFISQPGLLGRLGDATGYISGAFGAALATYTGVLVSNSAVPVWQLSRRWMPVLFASSSVASAASILDIIIHLPYGRRVTMVFGTAGRLAEIASALQVEAAAAAVPKAAEPFRSGATGMLWRTATALTAASLVVSLLPGKSQKKRVVAGILGAAGSLCLRFAIHYITNASSRDPRAAFDHQRSGLAAK